MGTYVVLLRGINLGSRRRVAMGPLRDVLGSSGYDDVRTYVQSGNVVLRSRSGEKALTAAIQRRLSDAFGFDIGIFVRSEAQLADVVANNPFLGPDVDHGRQLHVAFLETAPSRRALAGLDPHRAPPDELRPRGREVYVWAPNGIGPSKVLHGLDRILETTMTVRNWRTVTALLEMAGQRP
ncbi:MAG TPA: DUF1697 domain-containing protein [Acidimicrobiales bacterium]|nr:DUF1697 domain-containing protein [Acidimicrobiales bacterium]